MSHKIIGMIALARGSGAFGGVRHASSFPCYYLRAGRRSVSALKASSLFHFFLPNPMSGKVNHAGLSHPFANRNQEPVGESAAFLAKAEGSLAASTRPCLPARMRVHRLSLRRKGLSTVRGTDPGSNHFGGLRAGERTSMLHLLRHVGKNA